MIFFVSKKEKKKCIQKYYILICSPSLCCTTASCPNSTRPSVCNSNIKMNINK